MIDKNDFIELEEQIEPLVKQKQLKTDKARQLLDQYYKLIMDYFKQINEIEEFDIDNIFDLVENNHNEFNNSPQYNEYTNNINDSEFDPLNNDFFI